MNHLKAKKSLKYLNLEGCDRITDAGLIHLAGLENLQWLWLQKTSVTEKGLERLKGLKNLKLVKLPDSISQETIDKFRSEMPPGLSIGH